MNTKLRNKWIPLVALLVPLLTGCGNIRLANTSTELSSCISGGTQKVRNFYILLNGVHRQVMVDEQAIGAESVSETGPNQTYLQSNKEDQQALDELLSSGTGGSRKNKLLPYYSAAAIDARTTITSSLEAYGRQLDIVSSSTNASQAENAIKDLGTDLAGLGQHLADTNLPAAQRLGGNLSQLCGPIANLAGMSGKGILNYFRHRWAIASINQNTDRVDRFCTSLEDDANVGAERGKTKLTKLGALYQRAIKQPNSQLDNKKLSTELEKLSNLAQQIDQENPANMFSTFRIIHTKLANLAKAEVQP